MRRKLVSILAAAVLGVATAANAIGTLTVFTTDAANVARDTFSIGDTILIKVTGDSQGGSAFSIYGNLLWDAALTTTVGATQGNWLPVHGELFPADGSAYAFNQTSPSGPQAAINQVDTSVITLIADAAGSTQLDWQAGLLEFFGLYVYSTGNVPTGHSFTVVPEPASAALVGIGVLGLALIRQRA